MPTFYANTKPKHKENGVHFVHREGCELIPEKQHLFWLGDFDSCKAAVFIVQQNFSRVNGCSFCMPYCYKEQNNGIPGL